MPVIVSYRTDVIKDHTGCPVGQNKASGTVPKVFRKAS